MSGTISSWGPARVYFRDWTYFRFVWRTAVFGSVVQPVMYLLGVGLGIGELVDGGPAGPDALGGVSYFAFYATALIATTSMFVLGQESLWPTMDGFTWSEAHQAMISTPLTSRDVALGKGLYYGLRGLVSSAGVALVLACFTETRSWGLLPAIPVGVLTGLAFAMPFAAWVATRHTDNSFSALLRFGVVPMFLFGGAFYPIDQLPPWLEFVARLTPIWHGIELCRGLVLGGLEPMAGLVHLLVLLGFVTAGSIAATITFDRRLRP
ncbi:ABC transporter permease [Ilumatobacter sp.]|uniref:ABC transporter permease n=1 Tax=Ilumatobacter sp. TaxID=1967498 RepID=UPI003C324334